jgi:pimeloyl-ACP methyl ester carboxylesterase
MWLLQRRLDYSLTQARLSNVRSPTLVLWGGEDSFDAPWQAHDLARRIPGAIAHVLRECGHSIHEDCPSSANLELIRFLLFGNKSKSEIESAH